jgi:hypothetical protein
VAGTGSPETQGQLIQKLREVRKGTGRRRYVPLHPGIFRKEIGSAHLQAWYQQDGGTAHNTLLQPAVDEPS